MGRNRGHVPIRRCISCGIRLEKKALLRLVINEKGELKPDVSGKIQCRGAYVCNKGTCMEKLYKGRHLEKIFRTGRPVSLGNDLKSFVDNILGYCDKNEVNFGGIDG